MIQTTYRDCALLQLPDTQICYLRKGQGPAVLLLHGIPLSLLTWRHNIDHLAKESTVIAVDLKGFGMSGKPPGSYAPDSHARVIGQLLDALNLPCVSLIGSSYGCAVAIAFAHAYPKRVAKLVLINSVGYPGGPHSLERVLRIKILGALLRRPLRRRGVAKLLLASGLRKSYANSSLVDDELVEAYLTLLRRDSGDLAFLSTLQQFREDEVASRFTGITHQTLIIWGAQDHVLPVRLAHRIHRDIQRSRLEVLPDCGHLPHEEAPQLVNSLVAQFLSASDAVPVSEDLKSQPAYA